ncbi:leishmanolysin family protein, putative [Ichthyophthirius multifiliis]|uniref:Leishmanolysin family protein, putative n=1 Tax=Ichthyophthirius multifiliis TaxID=5932 RepID=G0R036_ICHMU|nr:leishmanolysin family protein, putative [Ichthyophthirius multifiliis]EGR29169.1 leishmanolysin family protein, putative [Ichthyophthirius multifiliis]|eukprot:XP_004030405.1 leishmanolysin family protein, putative [Ichthyophthirius multifiliis]
MRYKGNKAMCGTRLFSTSLCLSISEGLGPTHSRINFNLGQLDNKNINQPDIFEDLIEIVIHEITHVLGFSKKFINKWVNTDGSPHVDPIIIQEIRGAEVKLLKTPNVLKYAREYFRCSTLPGMPLENYGSDSSHWESTVIQNEYMIAYQSNTQLFFSSFTTNLLRDTGFYATINESMEEKTYYGKGQGCQYVLGQCRTDKREHCNEDDQYLQEMSVIGFNGIIRCPENIQEFCGYKKICPNFCSANGYCNNNKCYCIKGINSVDCSSNKSI